MFTLYIGNKNYSSWSLRPWLVMRHFDIPFRESRVALYQADSASKLRAVSPSGKVPVLRDGELVVWDSLAIGEYLAERYPEFGLWPGNARQRALARAVGVKTVAEFVENEDIAAKLAAMGVDYLQGYAIHEPSLLSEPIREVVRAG